MKKQLLVAVAAGFIGTSAMAASAFEGFYAQAGIGYENDTISSRTLWASYVDSNNTGTNGATLSAPSSSGGGFSGALGLGYNISVAPQWLVGIGADFAPTSVTTSTQPVCSGGCTSTNNYKVSNRYSVFLAPGYEIDKDKLAYLKAGYTGESISWQPQANFSGVSSQSTTASGYLVGLGYKQLLDKNLYVFGEGNYYSYSSKTQTGSGGGQTIAMGETPSAYQFLVGVGYKF